MKNILLSLLSLIFVTSGYSQEYPKFQVDSSGIEVVVLTIEQAQKLDNDSDLLVLFKNLNKKIGEYDTVCLKVINDKEVVISSQKMEISELNNLLKLKDSKVVDLQNSIKEYKNGQNEYKSEIELKNKIIYEKDIQIKKTKWRAGGIGVVIGIILGLLL